MGNLKEGGLIFRKAYNQHISFFVSRQMGLSMEGLKTEGAYKRQFMVFR